MKQIFGNRVAIKPIIDNDEKTASGIILTNKKGQQKLIGTVVAVGKGLLLQDGTRAPMDIEPGMTVMYKQYAGIQVKDGEDILIVMDAGDVIGEL